MDKQSYPAKVLLVDDDSDTVLIYQEFLTDAGYKVDVARNGQEGVGKIYAGGYDLILLDIMMPKIDGITILKKVKEDPPKVYNGPIIVLSALDQDYIVKTALNLGAKGYLAKANFSPEQALDKINEIIKNSPITH